jgi:CubicO group peptidase (beta-lactamase class C family)
MMTELERLTQRIDALFEATATPDGPGAQIALLHQGHPILRRAYGMAEVEHGVPHAAQTRYRLASVSKHYLSVLVLKLGDDGVIGLDAPIGRYLPELQPALRDIPLRLMLAMRSGIPDLAETLWLCGVPSGTRLDARQLHAAAARLDTLNFPPGTQISYSNTNYRLIQTAIERVTGVPLAALYRRHLFEPLGLAETTLPDDQSDVVPNLATGYWRDGGGALHRGSYGLHFSASGGLVASIGDLATWLAALWEGRAPMGGIWDRLVAEGATAADGFRYALGLAVIEHQGVLTIGHGGSLPGYKNHFLYDPAHRLGAIVVGNREDVAAARLALAALEAARAELLNWRAPAAPDAGPGPLPGPYLDADTGFTLDIRQDADGLYAAFLGAEERLQPTAAGGFRAASGHLEIDLDPIRAETGLVGRPNLVGQPDLVGQIGRGMPMRWQPVDATAALPTGAAGLYRHDRSGAVHEITVENGVLGIRCGLGPAAQPWTALEPLGGDSARFQLTHAAWTLRPVLRFTRDAAGSVSGFSLSSSRSRHLTFNRLQAGP